MDYKEYIGKTVYYLHNSKVKSDIISEGKAITVLNTGSDRHGHLMPEQVSYRLYNGKAWFDKDRFYFSKEELINSL